MLFLCTIIFSRNKSSIELWKKAQQELVNAEKLHSYESIIRGIVHEFNNLHGSISGHLELAEMSGRLPESLRGNIALCRKALSVTIDLSRQLAMYAKENEPDVAVFHISEIIQLSADLTLKGDFIQFFIETDFSLHQVKVDRLKIMQVFINLFINAKQAMPCGGKITVICNNYQNDHLNNFIKISLQDEGEGIPDEIIDRVFDPFFTTKPEGTGLGLHIVKNIIEAHHGTITVKSKQHNGTTFTILLPAVTGFEEDRVSNINNLKCIPEKKTPVIDDDTVRQPAFTTLMAQIHHQV
jgi:signal transduction histidine kinase